MTIRDIAKRCSVSVSTVSRVLNNHPDVSAASRARVLEAVREAHYVPNNSARDLVRPQSDGIGLVVRGVGNPFFTGVIQAIERAIGGAGYNLVLHQIRSEGDELRAGAELARSRRLLGLVLLGGRFDYTPEQVALLDVPFVCCSYTNSFGSLAKDAYSSVTIDDQREACRAVRLLTEQGHQRLAILLDSTQDSSISQLRYMGYRQALEESGLLLDKSLIGETGSFDMAAAYETAARLLAGRRDVTAVFAIADSMAVAAMKALHDLGRRVPEDCSVVSIDGIEMSAYTVPALTTLAQPQEEMGERAVRILVDMIEGRGRNQHVLLKTALRPGETIAPYQVFASGRM